MSIPFFSACGKNDPNTCNYVTEVQNESDALTAALTAYSNDPSTANCNAFKGAYQDYLNALEDHRSCAVAAGQGTAFQQAIDNAQASLDTLVC